MQQRACGQFEELLVAYTLGEATADERQRVEKHIVECRECHRRLVSLRGVDRVLADLPEVPDEVLPRMAAIDEGVERGIRGQRPTLWWRWGGTPRIAASLAMGVVALVLVWGVWSLLSQMPPPGHTALQPPVTPAPTSEAQATARPLEVSWSSRLVVEEYAIVDKEVASPDRLEYNKHIDPMVLEKRQAWRQLSPEGQVNRANETLSQFGYRLEPHEKPGCPTCRLYDLYKDQAVVQADLSFVGPVTTNGQGDDFVFRAETDDGQRFLITSDKVETEDPSRLSFVGPVYAGDRLVTVEERFENGGRAFVSVKSGQDVLYSGEVPASPVDTSIKGLWSWEGQWVVECGGFSDKGARGVVIIEGQSLNDRLGYDDVFGWRLLEGQPFYFFKKDGKIGVSHAGVTLPQQYDEVVHYQCCEPAAFNIKGNDKMVWFHALRDNTWYYVEMGVYGDATSPATVPGPTTVAPAPVDDLAELVEASLPAGAFEGVEVLQLDVPAGREPLWVAYTYGMRNHDIQPFPSHLVVLYTYNYKSSRWQELANIPLDTGDATSTDAVSPDFVGQDGGVRQVRIDPDLIWLEVSGGAGAHNGTYQLLSFDGNELHFEYSAMSDSPGFGQVRDVNEDGTNDVVIDVSDRYVFCRACGVIKIGFQVLTWDEEKRTLSEVSIKPMPENQRDHPAREAVDWAVELTRAGLWKDAMAKIDEARGLGASAGKSEVLDWDYALIKLHTDAMVDSLVEPSYPLLAQMFYGDYAAAVDVLRPYGVEEVFSVDSPVITNTVAMNFIPELEETVIETSTTALEAEPDLAPAYFLRGWAEYLADETSPRAQADLTRAAELAPNDELFTRARDWAKGD